MLFQWTILVRPICYRKQLKISVRHPDLLAFGVIVSTLMVCFALTESRVSWLSVRNSLVDCWQNVKRIPRRNFNINTLQKGVFHTCCFSCQNRRASMFLVLVMGAGKAKYVIYTNVYNKAVWKHSKWLWFQFFLQKKPSLYFFFLVIFFILKKRKAI